MTDFPKEEMVDVEEKDYLALNYSLKHLSAVLWSVHTNPKRTYKDPLEFTSTVILPLLERLKNKRDQTKLKLKSTR